MDRDIFPISFFLYFCAKHILLLRFLRIHPVQSVVNSPTQLSGRGFPHIFYMQLFLSQLYVFFGTPLLGRSEFTSLNSPLLGRPERYSEFTSLGPPWKTAPGPPLTPTGPY